MNWIAENIRVLKLALKNDEPISLICANALKKLFFSVDYYVAKRKLSKDEGYNIFLNRIEDEYEGKDSNIKNGLNTAFQIINISENSKLKTPAPQHIKRNSPFLFIIPIKLIFISKLSKTKTKLIHV